MTHFLFPVWSSSIPTISCIHTYAESPIFSPLPLKDQATSGRCAELLLLPPPQFVQSCNLATFCLMLILNHILSKRLIQEYPTTTFLTPFHWEAGLAFLWSCFVLSKNQMLSWWKCPDTSSTVLCYSCGSFLLISLHLLFFREAAICGLFLFCFCTFTAS